MADRQNGQILLLSEQALSEFGRQFTFILVPYVLVSVYSANAADLAIVSTAASVTAMLASTITAYLSRRVRTVHLAAGGSLLTMACLACVGIAVLRGWPLATVVLLYLLVTIASSTYSIGIVVAVTEVARSDDEYLTLNGRRHLVQSSASILGPSLIGALVMIAEPSGLFLVDALASLVSALVFLHILRDLATDQTLPEHADSEISKRPQPALHRYYTAVRTTMSRWVNNQGVLSGLIAPALITFCRRIVMTMLPILLISDFDATSFQYGIVYSAGGVGYLLAASICSWRVKRDEGVMTIMCTAITFGIACLGGLTLMVISGSAAHIAGACLFAAGSGAFGLLIDVVITTHRQRILGINDLTSVTSLSDAIETAGMLSAAVVAGILATIWEPRAVVYMAAIAYALLTVAVARATVVTRNRRLL